MPGRSTMRPFFSRGMHLTDKRRWNISVCRREGTFSVRPKGEHSLLLINAAAVFPLLAPPQYQE